MGKPKKRSQSGGGAQSSRPEELSLRELFNLIHRVNPTGRSISRAEMDARYAEKTRLQSALVREFSEVLRFRTERDPRIVAIGHESLGLDACHAIIAELEEDARSIVQHALDLHASEEASAARQAPLAKDSARRRELAERDAAPPPSPSSSGAQRLLDEGARALEEYDYDGARAAFEAAFAGSRGGLPAAVALLSLFLDHLADDAAARALEDSLGPEAKADPVVRARVALADARLGNTRDAEQRVIGVEVPEVAEVWLALAEASVARADLGRAQEQLSRARSYDPASARGSDVARKIAALRDAQQGAREAELRALSDAGELEAARALARSIVATFGDSREARVVLAKLAEQGRLGAAHARLEEARAAERAGDLGSARTLVLAARADVSAGDDADRVALRRELDAERAHLERRIDDRETDMLVERAIALLTIPPADAAVRAFLGLRPDRQESAIERSSGHPDRAIFDAARRLRAARPNTSDASIGQAVAALVSAVAALEAAGAGAAADAHPAKLLDGIEPHRATIAALAEGRERLAELDALVHRTAIDRAERALERAAELGATGDTVAAIAALEAVDLRGADVGTTDRVGARLAALRARAEVEALEAELRRVLDPDRPIEDARTAAQILDARALVDRLAASLGDQAAAVWSARSAERRRAVARRLEVARHPGAASSWCLVTHSQRMRSVRDDGAELIIPQASGDGVALHRYDLGASRVVETVRLQLFAAPELSSLSVRGARAFVADDQRTVYEIDLEAAEVVRVIPSRFTDADGDLELAWADELYLWFGGQSTSRTVRASGGVLVRQARTGALTFVLPGAAGDVVDSVSFETDRATLFTPAGKPLGMTFHHEAIARLPSGDGWVLLSAPPDRDDAPGACRCVSAADPSRWGGPPAVLPSWNWEAVTHASTSTEVGLTFAFMHDDERWVLRAFAFEHHAASGWRPVIVWSVPVTWGSSLSEDVSGRWVALIEPRAGSPCDARVVLLGRAPPPPLAELESDPHPAWVSLIWGVGYPDCSAMSPDLRVGASREERAAFVEELAADPARSAELVPRILGGKLDWVLVEERLGRLASHPAIRPLLLHVALTTSRWEAFERRMSERPPVDEASRALHDGHLDVLHAILEGRFDDAARGLDWMRSRIGLATPGATPCREVDLRRYLDAVRAVAQGEPPSSEALAIPATLDRLRALLVADAHLDAGDLDAAWAALDRRVLWSHGELQHLSRAALVVLSRGFETSELRTRGWLVLRRFLEIAHPGYWSIGERSLPLPPRWKRLDLDGLVERARDALGEIARADHVEGG